MSKSFNTVFAATSTTIAFCEEWKNGTGYFDHAAKGEFAPKLASGELVKTTDTHGRNMVLVGLPAPLGNLVVFKRFAGEESSVVVYNIETCCESHNHQEEARTIIQRHLGDRNLSDDQVSSVFGLGGKPSLSAELISLMA